MCPLPLLRITIKMNQCPSDIKLNMIHFLMVALIFSLLHWIELDIHTVDVYTVQLLIIY